MVCAKRAEREKKKLRWKAEVDAMKGPQVVVTVELLRATEMMLIAQGVAEGKTFKGAMPPEYIPTDDRIMWCESPDEKGVWMLTFVP